MSKKQNEYTKKVKLGSVKDEAFFKLSPRNGGAFYEMQSKKRGVAIFTSCNTGLTFERRSAGLSAYIKP